MSDMTKRMDFWMPPELARLLAQVARSRMISKSDYARQALIEKIQRDVPNGSTVRGRRQEANIR
jgi:hypothetical protein